MKLFYAPGACSLAPHIVLREAGLPFTLEKVDLARHLTETGNDYYSINPKGQVPLLEVNDTRLSEGPVIARFIADKPGNSTLLPPAGSLARYRVEEWQNYITSELHKSFTPLFNPQLEATAKQVLAAGLRKKMEWVSSQLADRDYLTGDHFTVADAYLFTVCSWSKHVALDIADLEPLQGFLARVAKRPAVREAMTAEGLLA